MSMRYSEVYGTYLSQLTAHDVNECIRLAMSSGVVGQTGLYTELDCRDQALLYLLMRLDSSVLEAQNQHFELPRLAFDSINSAPAGVWMQVVVLAFRFALERMGTHPTHQDVSRALAPVASFNDDVALAHIQLDILKHGAWGGLPMSKCGPQPDNYLKHWLSFFDGENGAVMRQGLEAIHEIFDTPKYLKYCFISMDVARRLTDQTYSTEFKEAFEQMPCFSAFVSATLTLPFRRVLQEAMQAGELHLTSEAKDMLEVKGLSVFKDDLMPLIAANTISRAVLDATPSGDHGTRSTPRIRRNGI